MKIAAIDIYRFDFAATTVTWTPVLINIVTDEGVDGIGEVALSAGVGNAAGLGAVREICERFLIGRNPFAIEPIWDFVYRQTFWARNGGPALLGAISAIDEALWDIKAKALAVPVYELLGGCFRERLKLYANGWFERCDPSPESHAQAANRVVEMGYLGLKFDPFLVRPDGQVIFCERFIDRELMNIAVDRVRAVREAVGPEIDIMIDVHGTLGTVTAIEAAKRLEPYNLYFLEEPVDLTNVETVRKVAAETRVPLAGGERLYTRFQAREFVERQVLDYLQPDVGLAGGITETKKIASMADMYHIPILPHNCGTPVSTAASVQIDAAISNFTVQEIFPFREKGFFDIVQESLEEHIEGGYLPVPKRPGIGVDINREFVNRFQKMTVTGA
jgi:galactonate dehydratase